jgi:two-component system, OmpR family, sensor kinase
MARAAVVFRNNAIELMVTQRGLAQQASMLEEKLTAERRLTQLQRNFVSMASHEFRTPLTIIDGHAGRLIKLADRGGERTGDRTVLEEISSRAGKIHTAVLRMTHLIENLLTSTRLIESGAGLYFHPEPIDLQELVHDVCQLHREISPGMQIVEEFGARRLPMVGDPKLLSQVFDNLLSNAIKYSPGGGVVKVVGKIVVAFGGDQIVVAVEDTGIGIPPKDIARLFERYFRGGNVSGIVGTGVGLNLVKMVVDLHGGDIAVASQEGNGSIFTIKLPMDIKRAAEQPEEPVGAARLAEDSVISSQ